MTILRMMAIVILAGGVALAETGVALAQRTASPQAGQSSTGGNPIGDIAPPSLSGLGQGSTVDDTIRNRTAKMERDQERARNSDRQRKLVEDTQRLVTLAGELKVDVDKTDKDTLSLDVIKKAEEIEKLAKSVKERMKGSS